MPFFRLSLLQVGEESRAPGFKDYGANVDRSVNVCSSTKNVS